MTLKGYITSFSEERTGNDNATGRTWQVRDIIFKVPYMTKTGKQREHCIIASCFNRLKQEQLTEMRDNKLMLEFAVEFSIHTYENKTFQDCRIYGVTMPVIFDEDE